MKPGTDRPRVLMVSGASPPLIDGVGDYTSRLLEALARRRPGWRWRWLARRPRWFHPPLTIQGGLLLIWPGVGWTPATIDRAERWVRRLRPDLLHVQDQIHSYYETDAAPRLAAAAGCPVVTTLHEYHVELPSVGRTTELVGLSSAVLANDARTAARCLDQSGRAVDRVLWSPSNIPVPASRERIAPVAGLVVTFGLLGAIKAVDRVHAGLALLREHRTELRWRIVGPFDPARDPLHAELARAMPEPWVEFTGGFPRPDDPRLGRLLAEASVMALPFADGASPRRTTLQAAWALGLPVVTTPPPMAEPSIIDGENCLLVREPTAEAWSAAFARILDDPALEARLRAGSLAAADRASWARLADAHLGIYETLLADRRGG